MKNTFSLSFVIFTFLTLNISAQKVDIEKAYSKEIKKLSTEKQIERVMQRDNTSRETVERVLSQQATRKERLNIANYLIVNDQDQQQLTKQVTLLHKKLLQICST